VFEGFWVEYIDFQFFVWVLLLSAVPYPPPPEEGRLRAGRSLCGSLGWRKFFEVIAMGVCVIGGLMGWLG